jgi:exodeoxyribonuclease VII small subunit
MKKKSEELPKSEPNFRDAYSVLQRHAETLRNRAEPNIDDLLTLVSESVVAYEVCRTRIDAVEKALEQALTAVNNSAE